jgi:hypothetical protein
MAVKRNGKTMAGKWEMEKAAILKRKRKVEFKIWEGITWPNYAEMFFHDEWPIGYWPIVDWGKGHRQGKKGRNNLDWSQQSQNQPALMPANLGGHFGQ